MLPRPYLEALREGDPHFKLLLEDPVITLGLFSTDEIAMLTKKSLQATPLSTSVYELLRQLVKPGSEQIIDHLNVIENTSEFVIYYSKFEEVKARLEAATSESTYSGKPSLTALAMVYSQKESDLLTVIKLIEKLKVDVNTHFASIPLYARGRSYDIVPGGSALLEKGADLFEPDPQVCTVLHHIASQCLVQQREHLDGWRWYNDLPEDFFDSCTSFWKRYISQGGSINVADNAGDTPLQSYLSMLGTQRDDEKGVTCYVNHYEILFPEKSKVDVFAVNKAGETALHKIASRPPSRYLVEGPDKALSVMMMEKGLDPLKGDAKGRSALDVASAFDKKDILGLLDRK